MNKFEARNSKFETISNDQIACPVKLTLVIFGLSHYDPAGETKVVGLGEIT